MLTLSDYPGDYSGDYYYDHEDYSSVNEDDDGGGVRQAAANKERTGRAMQDLGKALSEMSPFAGRPNVDLASLVEAGLRQLDVESLRFLATLTGAELADAVREAAGDLGLSHVGGDFLRSIVDGIKVRIWGLG